MDAVAHILDRHPDNLKHLIEYKPIADWLNRNEPAILMHLQSEIGGIDDVSEVVPERVTDASLATLADATELSELAAPPALSIAFTPDFRIFSRRLAMKRVSHILPIPLLPNYSRLF